MKIRLLNDAGYGDMEDVNFPVEVEADGCAGYFLVNRDELYRVGANQDTFEVLQCYAFSYEFCEVIS